MEVLKGGDREERVPEVLKDVVEEEKELEDEERKDVVEEKRGRGGEEVRIHRRGVSLPIMEA